jgi:hypothetical protein
MDAAGVRAAQGGNRKGKRRGRRPRGVDLKERDGYWHAHGTLRVNGRSIRVRKSLGLAVAAVTEDQARTELESYVDDLKAIATGKVRRGDPVGIAAAAYLSLPRGRPLRPSSISIVKEVVARFGMRRFNEVAGREWNVWIDGEHTEVGFKPGRMTGRSASTRERFLNSVLAFLAFAKRHHGLAALPAFERDKKARNPNRRVRRRVEDLRPDLVQLLFDSAHISIRAQLAVERATGARVSSVLFGVRLCDLVLGKKRAQITFRGTKNGEDVTAVLDGSTASVLRDYLKWRGMLHDREAPLFLTWLRKPYIDNGRVAGGQNKTGFRAAKRRACKLILDRATATAAQLRARGKAGPAKSLLDQAGADAALLRRVTQHWFRHRLATLWLRKDPRAAMEQGGWLDIRSVIGYSHDAPEYRRQIATEMDDLGTAGQIRMTSAGRRQSQF